jgi:type II secretory pathway pseudopilin PulG
MSRLCADGIAMRSFRRCERAAEDGFTYLTVLFAVVLIGLALAAAASVWDTASKREKEMELLFVGQQFRAAIDSYYNASPPAAQEFPRSLDSLLIDKRFPQPVRHLRRIYVDPVTGDRDWGLIKLGDRIIGVHSRSLAEPLKQAGFSGEQASFQSASTYADWTFVAKAVSAPGLPASPPRSPAPGAGPPGNAAASAQPPLTGTPASNK